MLKRNPEKYPETGNQLWDIVGGRINPGTPLLDNLKREVKEEIGLELEGKPKLIAAQDMLKTPGRHVVRLTYVGTVSGEPKPDGIDHTEYHWFSREELKNLSG